MGSVFSISNKIRHMGNKTYGKENTDNTSNFVFIFIQKWMFHLILH